MMTPEQDANNFECVFCHETGFDLIGLKSHYLNGDCEEFNKTENIVRIK